MREAPARHDRAATGDDAGDAMRRQRHIGEAHARMDREVIHALLACSMKGVLEHLPIELRRITIDLFQSLIDRHRTDRTANCA